MKKKIEQLLSMAMEHDVSDESFEKIKEHLKAKGEI